MNVFSRLLLVLTVAAATSGCTSNFRFPWEGAPLDPSRIATREPLEIPPDLTNLPPPAAKEKGAEKEVKAPVAGADESVSSILFNTPEPNSAESLGRDKSEQLPDWMSSSGATAKKAPVKDPPPKLPPSSILNPVDPAKERGKSATKGKNSMTR